MSLILIIAISIIISYIAFTKSQCNFTVCNPTLAPDTNCGGEPQVEWACSGFDYPCINQESECAACCRAEFLFLNDMSGGAYNGAQGLFTQQCQQDECTTFDPTQSPTEPSTNPSKYPSISPTEPSSAPSKYPSVTPSNNPSVTPSVPPSNMPSV
eukprot:277399_1